MPIVRTCIFQIISAYAMVWLACLPVPLSSCLAQSETDSWCAPAAALPFPSKAAYGHVYNRPFIVDQCFLTYEPVIVGRGKSKRSLVLELQQGAVVNGTVSYKGTKRPSYSAPRVRFKISFWQGDLSDLAGKTIIVKPGSPIDARTNYPMVTVETNTVAMRKSPTYATDLLWPNTTKTYLGTGKCDYGMRLSFSKIQGNQLPGYIILRVADKDHSFVEGYFYATVKDDWTNFLHMKPLENLNAKKEFPPGNIRK